MSPVSVVAVGSRTVTAGNVPMGEECRAAGNINIGECTTVKKYRP